MADFRLDVDYERHYTRHFSRRKKLAFGAGMWLSHFKDDGGFVSSVIFADSEC